MKSPKVLLDGCQGPSPESSFSMEISNTQSLSISGETKFQFSLIPEFHLGIQKLGEHREVTSEIQLLLSSKKKKK